MVTILHDAIALSSRWRVRMAGTLAWAVWFVPYESDVGGAGSPAYESPVAKFVNLGG